MRKSNQIALFHGQFLLVKFCAKHYTAADSRSKTLRLVATEWNAQLLPFIVMTLISVSMKHDSGGPPQM